MVAKRIHRWQLPGSMLSLPDRVGLGTEALKVIGNAETEAQRLEHDAIRTCHLLWALVAVPGRWHAALVNLGISQENVHGEIENFRADELKADGASADVEIDGDEFRLSRRAKEVVDEAQEEAYVYGRPHTTPTDLLLALTKTHCGTLSDKVLERLGLEAMWVHSQVIGYVKGWSAQAHEHEIERHIRHIDELLEKRP